MTNSILLNNTPIIEDLISLINDFTVGDNTYWKGKYDDVMKELYIKTEWGEKPYLLFNEKNVKGRKNGESSRIDIEMYGNPIWNGREYYTDMFKRIMKKEKLKTKKDICDYYEKVGLFSYRLEKKEAMRLKKDMLIWQYTDYCSRHVSTNAWRGEPTSIHFNFPRKNLYQYYR